MENIERELERESGKLIWSFDIAKAGTKDITGAIRVDQVEAPKDQRAEAAADRVIKK